MKRLFNQYGQYVGLKNRSNTSRKKNGPKTCPAWALNDEVQAALLPIYERWRNRGYDRIHIQHIMERACDLAIVLDSVERRHKALKKRKS